MSIRRLLAFLAGALFALLLVASPSTSQAHYVTATCTTDTPSWVGDYETGDLSQFDSTSWNNVPTAPAVVTTPVFDGGYAGKYVIPAGGSRSENVPTLPDFTEGTDLWFGWSTMLGTGFPVNVSNWQVINQWKNDGTGSPPLELKVSSSKFTLDGGYGYPGGSRYWSKPIGPATVGVWDRWTAHIVFSSDTTVATVDLWRNGAQVIAGLHPPTLYPGLTSYLKVGYYRDSAINTTGTVYQDAWKVGTTEASVA